MAFHFPGTEVYDAAGKYRVVWSPEEYAEALSSGWLVEKPEAPKGDGVTDDTAAIQALLDTAARQARILAPEPVEPKKKKSRD